MADQNFGDYKTTNWNGQQVVTDDRYKSQLAESAANYNKVSGQNLTAEQYDRQINPGTAGARWGDAAPPPMTTTPGTGQPSGGGLLTPSTPPAAASTVPQATATTYDPTKQTVSGESLVQNQLASITSTGSKLNELAGARAAAAANRRGLLNSSIAVESGEKAVLESALPIAQQDASTNAAADAANAQFSNAASQFGAAAKNTANLANQQAALSQRLAEIQANTTMSVADKQLASQKLIADNENKTRLTLAQMDADTKKVIQNLDNDSKFKLSQLEADNRQLLQTNISAANAYAQYAQALSQISTNKDMNQAAKQTALDNQLEALRATLRAIGQVSGLDLSKYYQTANTAPAGSPQTDAAGNVLMPPGVGGASPSTGRMNE